MGRRCRRLRRWSTGSRLVNRTVAGGRGSQGCRSFVYTWPFRDSCLAAGDRPWGPGGAARLFREGVGTAKGAE